MRLQYTEHVYSRILSLNTEFSPWEASLSRLGLAGLAKNVG